MNQDIIDWLEGHWEKNQDDYCGYGEPRYDDIFSGERGELEYHPKTGILYIWSGLGLSDSYGYEVQIQDLAHLIQLEALL